MAILVYIRTMSKLDDFCDCKTPGFLPSLQLQNAAFTVSTHFLVS